MTTSENIARGRLFWGGGLLPPGAKIIGVVTHENGEAGALIQMPDGRYIQGNGGVLKLLPPKSVFT
jgi:hypothetical protein